MYENTANNTPNVLSLHVCCIHYTLVQVNARNFEENEMFVSASKLANENAHLVNSTFILKFQLQGINTVYGTVSMCGNFILSENANEKKNQQQ